MHDISRPVREKTKSEIESQISKMGDYVKMSYLQRALKSGLDFETKRYVLLKLANIYESRGMFLEAAKMVKLAAEINKTFKDKRLDFMRAVDLYIKGSDFTEADRIFVQTLALGNENEKTELKGRYKDNFLKIGKENFNKGKKNIAKKYYEKALTLELNTGERAEVQKQLLNIYEKLGNIKEFMNLRKTL